MTNLLSDATRNSRYSYYRVYANKMQDLISTRKRILGYLIMQLNIQCDDLYQKIT